MSSFSIDNVETINIFKKPTPEKLEIIFAENKIREKKIIKELPFNLIFNPWKFWDIILAKSSFVSFVGYLVIFTIIYLIFSKNNLSLSLIYTLLFLFWIGPIIYYTPLLLLFAIPNTLSGNFLTPIGCGPRKVNGLYVDCI